MLFNDCRGKNENERRTRWDFREVQQEWASKYFEKIYISRRIEELNELADFYDEVGKPAYENISDMVVKKAMAKFKELSFEDQLDFFMKYANKNMVDEVPKLFADLKDLSWMGENCHILS